MKSLFVFDGPMYVDVNGNYCNTTLTTEVLRRYLKYSDSLTIIMRTFNLSKTYKEEGLHFVDLSGVEMIETPNINRVNSYLSERRRVNNIIKQEVKDADQIYVRMPSVLSNMTIKHCIKMKKSFFTEVGGCIWDAYWNHSIIGKLLAPMAFLQTKNLIRKADFGTYVTSEFLQKRYPIRGVSTNASNVYLQDIRKEDLNFRQEKIKRYTGKRIVLGTVASVDVRYKGQEYVIRAIPELLKRGVDIEYHMIGVGAGDRLKKIAEQEGVSDKCVFHGVKTHDYVMHWFKDIDLYIQPSKQEGLPRALIEAMSCGVPSLGSKTAGIPELLDNKYLFNKGAVDEIVNLLLNLTISSLEEMSVNNFKKSKDYTLESIEIRRNKLYSDYVRSLKE